MFEIGYGAGAIADYPWHIDGTRPWSQKDELSASDCLLSLREMGIRFVDTANRYGGGISEAMIGSCLNVEDFTIITKIEASRSEKEMRRNYHQSLARLGKIDGLLLHNPDLSDFDLTCAACKFVSSINEILYFGISTEPTFEVEKYYDMYGLNAIEFPYSPADRRAEQELFPWAGKEVLKIANRVLGGPGMKTRDEVSKGIRFASKSGMVNVALVGTIRREHLAEAIGVLRGGS